MGARVAEAPVTAQARRRWRWPRLRRAGRSELQKRWVPQGLRRRKIPAEEALTLALYLALGDSRKTHEVQIRRVFFLLA